MTTKLRRPGNLGQHERFASIRIDCVEQPHGRIPGRGDPAVVDLMGQRTHEATLAHAMTHVIRTHSAGDRKQPRRDRRITSVAVE